MPNKRMLMYFIIMVGLLSTAGLWQMHREPVLTMYVGQVRWSVVATEQKLVYKAFSMPSKTLELPEGRAFKIVKVAKLMDHEPDILIALTGEAKASHGDALTLYQFNEQNQLVESGSESLKGMYPWQLKGPLKKSNLIVEIQ